MMNLLSPEEVLSKNTILYIGKYKNDLLLQKLSETDTEIIYFDNHFLAYANCLSNVYAQKKPPYAFILREDPEPLEAYNFISNLKKCPDLKSIPIVLYNPEKSRRNFQTAKFHGADDFYTGSFELQDMLERIDFLHKIKKKSRIQETKGNQPDFSLSISKRLFDFCFSVLTLLLISPIFLIIALLIKLESKGPVFYISKRVGTGYKIFDFYKFRSMTTDADQQMQNLMHLNQYNTGLGTTFVKIDKDPRITKVGRFIRNSSLDELPQLINVLKGDMSIVGNRPLPLYEAEKITKDLWSKRFLAPAGLTGLWQVSKRGKKDMSAEERIALDMQYADNTSFWFDIKIIGQTFPAMIQKESV